VCKFLSLRANQLNRILRVQKKLSEHNQRFDKLLGENAESARFVQVNMGRGG
jgi:hypothetical protein